MKSGQINQLWRYVLATRFSKADTSINQACDHAAVDFYLFPPCQIRMKRRLTLTLMAISAITGIVSIGYAITGSARPASFALSGMGAGLIDCIGGNSFQMDMTLIASQNPEGTVSGLITIKDQDGATTIALVDSGKIDGKNFQLSSSNPKSVDDVPICHAGDDPNKFELRGVADEEANVRFEAVCKDEGKDGIECSNSRGTFEGKVIVTTR